MAELLKDKMRKAKPCELDFAKIKMCTKYVNGSEAAVITLLRTALIMTQM